MNNFAFVVLSLITGAFRWDAFFLGKLPWPYRTRSCQGQLWKDTFPNASNDEIRLFLVMFTDAFAFSEKEKLKFSPNDSILQIYRALYPSEWQPDAFEVETLAGEFESKYGVNFGSIWREDLSLGELFEHSRKGKLR